MAELVAAIGLALVIEGLFCAAAPDVARRAMAEAAQAPRERLRLTGTEDFGCLAQNIGNGMAIRVN